MDDHAVTLEQSAPPGRAGLGTPAMVAAVALGCGACWGLGVLFDVTVTQPGWRTTLLVGSVLATTVAVVGVGVLVRRRPAVAADLVVVLTGVVAAGLATLALHGTRWGWVGLYSDSAFRTQMATRYAENLGLVDFGYRGLPPFYPPAVGWLEGRAADVLGIAGWEAIKPVQLVLTAAIPLLAYALWRRVLPPLSAALVVAATTMTTIDPLKPDEWLVLACLLPWWLDAVRGVRAAGVEPWPSWRHGVVAGLLLLTHTYFFLPFAVATVVGMAIDVVRRRAVAPPMGHALVIAVVGLAVSAVYWVPLAVLRLSGTPTDSLQLRYTYPGAHVPPYPVPVDVIGVLGCIGFGWLLWSAWRWQRHDRADRAAGGLAVVLASGYLTIASGQVGVALDVGFLAFKADELVVAVQVACGVLGVVSVARWVAARRSPLRLVQVGLTAVSAAVALSLVAHYLDDWILTEPALIPQTTRYPDGSWPDGRAGLEPVREPPTVNLGDPSVERVLATWDRLSGAPPRSETVLVASRADLLGTVPVYFFVPFKSIYSHPNGQFEARVALLRRVAGCPDARCAADLLRNNPYDRVDGLILERTQAGPTLRVYVDNFPDRTRLAPVTFPRELFDTPYFRRDNVGRLMVVALTPTPARVAGE